MTPKQKKANQVQQWRLNNPERVKQYNLDNKEKTTAYMKQWRLDNKEHREKYQEQWRLDNKEHVLEYSKQHYKENKEYYAQYYLDNNSDSKTVYFKNIKKRYGLTEEMFIKIYQDQKGICLGCDIKLVLHIFPEEIKKCRELKHIYYGEPKMILNIDYAFAYVDHDHSFDVDGKRSGNPDSVRGLLCPSCNQKDVLNPKSDNYIYGDDPIKKEQLVMNRIFNKQLKKVS